jgi:hypothetical protein
MDEEKKPDLVVWSKERGYYAKELTYGSNLGAPAIQLENVDGWKKNQALEVNKQLSTKFNELKEQYEKMLEEVYWNEAVYSSQYNFIPNIGETYYLYLNKGKTFLSLIEPTSWNMECLGGFKLDSNKKWNKI